MKCPICEGEGGWHEYVPWGLGQGEWLDCSFCEGAGKVRLGKWIYIKFWNNLPERAMDLYIDVYIKLHPKGDTS